MSHRPESPDTEAVFSSISAQARETNRIRVAALEDLLDGVGSGGLSDPDRRQAKDIAHQIAGSAGTFGFDRASDIAREVEGLLVADPGVETTERLRSLVADLRAELD